jgi:hypothetical protein
MTKLPKELPDNPRDALRDYIRHLEKHYYQWYRRSVRVNYYIMLSAQLIALIAGFTTSLVAAVFNDAFGAPNSDKPDKAVKIILIVLPFIGSLASTVLIQSHVSERWRLREEGRIAYQSLITDGRRRFATATKPDEFAEIYKDLEKKALQIEKRQSVRFFEHPPAFIQPKDTT